MLIVLNESEYRKSLNIRNSLAISNEYPVIVAENIYGIVKGNTDIRSINPINENIYLSLALKLLECGYSCGALIIRKIYSIVKIRAEKKEII